MGCLSLNNPSEAYEAGFRFIHQELNIIPQVSVAENILLGRSLPSRFGFAIDWNKVFIQAKEALEFLRSIILMSQYQLVICLLVTK